MKRLALLAGFLACAGCFTAAPPADVIAPSVQAAKSYPPVTVEQISEKSAHQGAQALAEEMDREQQQNLLTTTR